MKLSACGNCIGKCQCVKPAARVEQPTPPDVRETFKQLLSRTTGKAWEYYETVSGKYIVREDDGDDAGALAQFESADDAAFVCSAKNAIAELLTAPAAPVVEQRELPEWIIKLEVDAEEANKKDWTFNGTVVLRLIRHIKDASQRTEGEGQTK